MTPASEGSSQPAADRFSAMYQSQITARRGGGDLRLGLPLTITVEQDSQGHPRVSVGLGGEDITPYCGLSVDAGHLTVVFDLRAAADDACGGRAMYLQGQATLSATARSFTGRLDAICGDRTGTPAYGWRGEAGSAEAVDLLAAALAQDIFQEAPLHRAQAP